MWALVILFAHFTPISVWSLGRLYQAKIKQEKPVVKQVHLWTEQSKVQMRDCFDQTDWKMFFNVCDNIHDITDTIMSYFIFCESNCVQTTTVYIQIIRSGSIKILKYTYIKEDITFMLQYIIIIISLH